MLRSQGERGGVTIDVIRAGAQRGMDHEAASRARDRGERVGQSPNLEGPSRRTLHSGSRRGRGIESSWACSTRSTTCPSGQTSRWVKMLRSDAPAQSLDQLRLGLFGLFRVGEIGLFLGSFSSPFQLLCGHGCEGIRAISMPVCSSWHLSGLALRRCQDRYWARPSCCATCAARCLRTSAR